MTLLGSFIIVSTRLDYVRPSDVCGTLRVLCSVIIGLQHTPVIRELIRAQINVHNLSTKIAEGSAL